jgi:UrcA family protein
MKSKLLALGAGGCAFTLAALLGAPAQADMSGEMAQKRTMEESRTARRGAVTRSIVVAYGDLDLAVQAGAETLYGRMRGAARAVCGPRDPRIMELRREWARCVDKALDNAVAASGSERVVVIHREASGRDVKPAPQVAGIR